MNWPHIKKINAQGIAHILVPIATLLVIGGIGSYIAIKSLSHADTPGANGTTSVPLGVVLGPEFSSESASDFMKTMNLVKQTNTHWVRTSVRWYQIETSEGTYDWSSVDRLMRAENDYNVNILINVDISGSLPNWANGAKDHRTIPASLMLPAKAGTTPQTTIYASYADFVGKLVKRIHNDQVKHGTTTVDYFQIDNEPNRGDGWLPTPNVAQYIDFLHAAHDAIKQAAPQDKVLSPGLGANSRSTSNITGPDFVNQLYAAGAQKYFDILSFHPYYGQDDGTPNGKDELVHQIIPTMAKYGDRNKPIWLTEYGVPSKSIGLTQQGQILKSQYEELRAIPQVAHIFWYGFRDSKVSSAPDFTKQASHGLVDYNLKPKPAYDAFKALQ